uniref:Uncharacterized protein n=1 Tax=uncultured Desulfobacterium sp. TaxID=201089 RepID=E1YCK0_9BACT|nr:unknown protein [uncultured Desulfobacterium sp.]
MFVIISKQIFIIKYPVLQKALKARKVGIMFFYYKIIKTTGG